MKKGILALGAIITMVGGYAVAYPQVGDEAKWAGTYKKGTDPEKTFEITMKVLTHDVNDKEWDVQIDKTMDGVKKSKVEDIDEDKMYSSQMWTMIQAKCVEKGGTLEDVTVPAGTFPTCHKTKTHGDKTMEIWWGDVPFGIVKASKMDTKKQMDVKAELQSFTAAPGPVPPTPPPAPEPEPAPEVIF